MKERPDFGIELIAGVIQKGTEAIAPLETLFHRLLSKENVTRRRRGRAFLAGKTDGSATEKPEPFSKR